MQLELNKKGETEEIDFVTDVINRDNGELTCLKSTDILEIDINHDHLEQISKGDDTFVVEVSNNEIYTDIIRARFVSNKHIELYTNSSGMNPEATVKQKFLRAYERQENPPAETSEREAQSV